jgi:hypothetical protein
MAYRNSDPNAWLDTYRDTFSSFAKAQEEGFRVLERFARFHYAVGGDVLEVGLGQARAAWSARAAIGTHVIADLLQRQAELGAQLSEKLKARALEFSALAAEVQDSVGSFGTEAVHRGRSGLAQGKRASGRGSAAARGNAH